MPFNNYIEKEFKEIVALLSKGEYLIPRFQRGLVWKREQVANFLDSILMGYPTGIFVLWKSKEKLACRKMGDSAPKELKEGEVFYVLDGQQRMSALYLVYEGLTLPQAKGLEENYKDILLSVEPNANGEYCFVKPKKSEKIEQAIRATDLLRSESIYDIEEKYGLDKKTAREFERFKTKLLNYKFPIVEITDASLEEIIKIFTRINTGGTKLSLSEILYAKFYIAPTNTQKGFDLEAHFKELQEELKSLDYGFNSCVVVLQLISFILRYNASGNLTEKISTSTLLKLEPRSIEGQWKAVAPCFKEAAHLLKHSLKIPSSDFLPSANSLMLIAYFFVLSEGKSPNASQITNLQKLFFRSAFFSSSPVGDTLLKQLGLIRRIYQEETIDFNKELPYYITKKYLMEEKLNIKNGLHRGVFCVLATLEPKNFDNNSKVVLDHLFVAGKHKRNFHHFFPKKYLENKDIEHVDVIANITLIDARLNQAIKDKSPQIYIADYQQVNKDLQTTLQTHLITLDDPEMLKDYSKFLNLRARLILEKIREIT
ncbi:GmrSD restriction endonuclease domain-containing protein [Helicobacter suis]|uniref:GmrSD restriction endonuclease domain-containing protein n=1 Tax=Helicobacter suis TaxID=104628 RepID=UPI0013D60EDF|nr:DUF262 domain-containing protein [Helicobacter suis]